MASCNKLPSSLPSGILQHTSKVLLPARACCCFSRTNLESRFASNIEHSYRQRAKGVCGAPEEAHGMFCVHGKQQPCSGVNCECSGMSRHLPL
jgi:hypothetical protein